MNTATITDTQLHVLPVESASALVELRAEWESLDRGAAFCSWQWLDSWWQHYSEPQMRLLTLAVRNAAGDLVGLAPWYLSQSPGQGRVIRFLGSGDVCSDYLTVLARPNCQEQVGHALADWLSTTGAPRWDLLELTGLADQRPVMDYFRGQLAVKDYLVHEQSDVNCWRLTLPSSWDAYLATLSKSRRPHMRALCRRNFDTGRVTLHVVKTPDQLERAFDILIDLHQKRRESLDQPGCFSSRRFTDFQRDVASRMLASGRLRLLWLELEGRPIAIEYGFSGGGAVYYYQGGFDPEVAHECPGTLMCLASLKQAIEERQNWFDFLRGDEPYKASWRAEPTPLRQLRVVARRPSARVRHAAWRTGETVKRWAKQGLNLAESWTAEARRVAAAAPSTNTRKQTNGKETEVDRAEIGDELKQNELCSDAAVARTRSPAIEPTLCGNANMWFRDTTLLNLYYYGTYPLRRWQSACRKLSGRAPVSVLFYHRIAEDRANAWTASPRIFARQIRWLQKHFDLVSLAEAQSRIRSPRNERPAVSITFDDGYADNCRFALPLLRGQGIPVTYFVSTAHVLEGLPFLHDLKRGKTLQPNTPEEIRTLAEQGVEIGAHTRTHANLGRIRDTERLWYELAGAKKDLEDLTGKPVRYFAFPYGQHSNLNREAFSLARQCGFEGVCSAYGGYNFPGDDPFHLQRIHADSDMIRLKNWMTVDPRKLKKSRRYAYQSASEPVVAGEVNS